MFILKKKMVQMQINLDKEESLALNLIKTVKGFGCKQEAVKYLINESEEVLEIKERLRNPNVGRRPMFDITNDEIVR